ncbi:filamentous hemagglutinin N-terminal domain-containing protein [Alkalinema pantanalense CENA528]|uniref:two-partner secretion domain-containing protein n=1 Tax=Alkalinema pantanalense TaxID=1620705 RepID=UPI003D6F2ED5
MVNLKQWRQHLSRRQPLPRDVRLLSGCLLLAPIVLPGSSWAQIAGDGTLGTQVNGSPIAPCTGNCTITSGTLRGENLFHSFREFSLPNRDLAGFVTTPAIRNVIVRVTGLGDSFISNINGTIATSNPANVFLLNPNGIIFGPRAAVNIGGSFLATTGDRLQFSDGTVLRTNDPSPLLTLSVPIGIQMGQAPGDIRSRMRISSAVNSRFTDFALIGGNITLESSLIFAPGHQIQLASIGPGGTVDLGLNRDRLNITLPINTVQQNITLNNESVINVAASQGGGGIQLTGRNIVLNKSFLISGILRGNDNAADNQAGNITVNAQENLQLNQGSAIANEVARGAIGQGGEIVITATNVQALEGSNIATRTAGGGNAGKVQVTANIINLSGISSNDIGSGIGSLTLDSTGNARGGDIIVTTHLLTLTQGSTVLSSTFGNGIAGNVQVTAKTIILDGSSPKNQSPTGIASQVAANVRGQGGNITVQTDSLTATNGANISASTFGIGNAGNVTVKANTIVLEGTTPSGSASSGIFSAVNETGIGEGGDIIVQTGTLRMNRGATVSAKTFGIGNAGNVDIIADRISVEGVTPDGQFATSITSEVGRTGKGQGGNVTIAADGLTITQGGTVAASTFGQGPAGNVRVKASTIVLDSTSPDFAGGGIVSVVAPGAIGRGGTIGLETGSLTVTNGATVSTGTAGVGDAGKIEITAETIDLNGTTANGQSSGIASQVARIGQGQGGDIRIQTKSLNVTNGAGISTSNLSRGQAGNLEITADTIRLINDSEISAGSVSGNGANIVLNAHNLLLLREKSNILTSAGTIQAGGNGGNITIATPFILGVLGENSDIRANAFTGNGGNITITTNAIYGLQFQSQLTPFSDITASSQFGLNGTVTLNTLNIDPNRGLVALPTNLADPANKISQDCQPSQQASSSSFVVSGRGGLPLSPEEPLENAVGMAQWVPLPEESTDRQSATPDRVVLPVLANPVPIVQAQGWRREPDGTVKLVSAPMGHAVWLNGMAGACSARLR